MYVKKLKRLFFTLAVAVLGLSFVITSPAAPLNIQHWRSASGVPIYLFSTNSLPMLEIKVLFDAGSVRDGKKFGLASLTNDLLATGTASLTVDQIAERFDATGALFSYSAGRDGATVSVRTLTEKTVLSSVLTTLEDVLNSPTFPQKQFDRVKNETLQSIKESKQLPGVVASERFFKLLYGDQAYGHRVDGTINTVKQLTREDVRKFYRRFYCKKNAKIVLVGDITRQQAETMVNRLTKNMAAGQAAPSLPPAPKTTAHSEAKINFPSAQSTILMGQVVGMTYLDPDYVPLIVGNHILGRSSLTSRLFREVRDKRGLVYGVGSQFYPLRLTGPFLVSLKTRNSKVADALTQVHTTLNAFLRQGPTRHELIDARKNIAGSFIVNNLTSNAGISGIVTTIARYDLPLNYFDEYLARVRTVKRQDILRAFQQRIHPKNMVTVIVGKQR